MERKRYIVRKEYFGAYVYDRDLQLDYIFDEESAEVFSCAFKDIEKVEKQDLINLCELKFVTEGNILNFDYFENNIFGEVFTAPIVVHFPYTYRCNLNCKHCFTKESGIHNEMTFSQKIKILNRLKELGVCKLAIGGGEPFICGDFVEFLSECVERGFVTKAYTNGLSLNDDVIDSVSKLALGGISVSIDSASSDVYKEIRGIDGLSRIVENIKKLVAKCSFPIAMSATIGKYNLDYVNELLFLAKDCGVSKLKIRPVRPSGNACENAEILIGADIYANYLRKIQKAYNDNRFSRFFKLDLNWGSGKIVATRTKLDLSKTPNPYGEFGCIAGKDILNINPDGSVFACGFLPSITNVSDNVLNTDIAAIWKNSENFKKLREIQPNKTCYRCRYYGNCRGGCPARSLYEKLNYTDVDPWCPRKFFPISL